MTNENLIHVRLEREEARQSKIDVLSAEKNLLETIKSMKKYFFLRDEELKLKSRLSGKVRQTSISIRKLENSFPRMNKKISKGPKEKKENEINYDNDLEKELQEIKEKLKAMIK